MIKITLIELNLWCSIVTHQSALTLISDFFPSSEVATMWQTDCYELRSLGLDTKTTLVLSNTRELNRELFYKLVYLL